MYIFFKNYEEALISLKTHLPVTALGKNIIITEISSLILIVCSGIKILSSKVYFLEILQRHRTDFFQKLYKVQGKSCFQLLVFWRTQLVEKLFDIWVGRMRVIFLLFVSSVDCIDLNGAFHTWS